MNRNCLMYVLLSMIACIDDGKESAERTADSSTSPNSSANSPLNSSPGCDSSSSELSNSLMVEGEARTFVLSLPNDYDEQTAHPLIFAWHGLGGTGNIAKGYFGLQQHAGEDAIIVYPDGLPQQSHDGETGWELRASGSDLVFFDQLITHITENSCVNLDQIFSTGHSFGGYMSNFLGCQRGDILNAIAPVAGGGPWGGCQGTVGAMIIHGSNDSVVRLSEGEDSLSKWQSMNDCAETSTDSSSGYCVSYDECTNPVEWCEYASGHMWPSFAAELIWDFFLGQ